MILKGSQRGGGRQLALHLLNGEQNEHVSVHEISGFMADDVLGALNEIYAISKGTRCSKFMYSLSLSPPIEAKVSEDEFEKAIERAEKRLELEGQPRIIVFHEKEGRRHAHCVWSRINVDEMKAINIAHDRNKLNSLAKSLYLENGWRLPDGFRDRNRSNPLNFTRADWQQAMRIGRRPQDIANELRECWAISDNRASFENALHDFGYRLAQGDKKGVFLAVDLHGEIYSLRGKLKIKAKDLADKLGPADKLQSLQDTKDQIQKDVRGVYARYADELKQAQHKEMQPLLYNKNKMTDEHRRMRSTLEQHQQKRWQEEENARASRIRSGFKGLWDKINGRYWKTRKINEQETYRAAIRDQKERDALVHEQLKERAQLQNKILELRNKHTEEQRELVRECAAFRKEDISREHDNSNAHDNERHQEFFDEHDRDGLDHEPEI